MNIIIGETYEDMCRQALDGLLEITQSVSNPLVCTASGDTPAGVYKQLVEQVKQENLDISNWNFVGLDEWVGMDGDDEGSCRFYVDRQLFVPLQIPESRICFFNGRAENLQQECGITDDFISKHGGMDVAIVGLGLNGHVGMNEPGISSTLHSHLSQLAATTIEVGQKYFKKATPLSQGITLGLASLFEARHIILLVNGQQKASIVKQILEGEISNQWPASLLRQHENFHVFLTKDAALLLQAN